MLCIFHNWYCQFIYKEIDQQNEILHTVCMLNGFSDINTFVFVSYTVLQFLLAVFQVVATTDVHKKMVVDV